MSTEYIVNRAAPTPYYKADEELFKKMQKTEGPWKLEPADDSNIKSIDDPIRPEFAALPEKPDNRIIDVNQLRAHGIEVIEPEPVQESEVAEPLTDEPDERIEEADIQAAKLRLNLMLSSFQSKMVDQDEYNLRFQEFQEFQQKVIRAFKEIGLDTRKHFGV